MAEGHDSIFSVVERRIPMRNLRNHRLLRVAMLTALAAALPTAAGALLCLLLSLL